MKRTLSVLLVLITLSISAVYAQTITKPKVIVTTDMGADPDDEQSMVRFLVSCNEFDVQGIITATGCWRKTQSTSNMDKYMNPLLNAYTTAYNNLKKHSADFPTPAYLKSVSVLGNTAYGMSGVGSGKDSPGSNLIISAVDATTADNPVWVQSWGGSNNLAQALWKVKNTRTQAQVDEFVSKVHCYDILGQDDAGAWIVVNFPNLIYLRGTSVYGWQRSKSDGWWASNVQNHGALGSVYPNGKYAMEGDTPAFLHVLGRGLNNPADPKQRGWGGQFLTKKANIASMSEVAKISNENQWGTYYMYGHSLGPDIYKQAIENDFQARMDWANSSNYSSANHHPVVKLNGDATEDILKIYVSSGQNVSLSAAGSTDPDNNTLSYKWNYYQTDGTYGSSVSISNSTSQAASVTVPSGATGKEMHFVVEVKDNGSPSLTSYRRAILIVGNAPNPSPVISISSPANNTSIPQNTSVTIQATATTTSGTITSVEFYDGSTKLGEDLTSPYSYVWTGTTAGTHSVSAKAIGSNGTSSTSSISVVVTVPQGPYGGTAHPIPGIIQFEEFDLGGNGVAYSDDSPGTSVPSAPSFRSNEDVDIENCTDAGGGYNIGYATAGEWLEYTVDVTASGTYNMALRVACNGSGRTVNMSIDGVSIASNVAIPNTAGWQAWQTVTVNNLALTAGTHIMRLTMGATDYVNLNYVSFTSVIVNEVPTVTITAPLSGTSFTAPASVLISANASDTDGTITKVEFYNGTTKLGEDATAPYSYTWENVAAGTYSITAVATDNGSATKTSSAVSVIVSAPNVSVTDVSLTPISSTINEGSTTQLTTTVLPANATNKSVTYSSSNTSVATVSSTGLVTGIAAGTATITVTTTDGAKTATADITVNAVVGATKIWLESECGAVGSLFDKITDANASNGSYVSVKSGNNSLTNAPSNTGQISYPFTVSESGTYSVWARVITPNPTDDSFWIQMDGGSWYMWNNIGPASNWAWVKLTTSYNLSAGTHNLAVGYREDGAKLDKLYITNGTETPSSIGLSADNCSNSDVLVTSVSIAPTSSTINEGSTAQLTATVLPANATNKSVTYSSSNTSVATVSSTGLVTGVATGTAIITVTTTDGAKTATADITVNAVIGATKIWLESECGSVGSLFDKITDANASNGSYVSVKSGNNSLANASSSTGQISYPFTVSESGTYSVWARVITPNPNDDSFWMQMDGGSWYMWNNIGPVSNWAWVKLTTSYNLSAGTHNLAVGYREDGAKLDKLYITNGTETPTSTGLPADNCNSNNRLADNDANNLISVSTFPNPFSEEINIIFENESSDLVEITFTNTLGEVVKSIANSNTIINTSDLPSGVYLLRVSDGNTSQTIRLVKE